MAFLVPVVCFSGAVSAFETKASFSGTLIEAPSCVLNEGKSIVIDYGDVDITQIDGVNYSMPVDYTLTCESGAEKAMRFLVKGDFYPYNRTLLKTSNDNLAIGFKNNNELIPINDVWINFTYPDNPVLTAVLRKRKGVELTTGRFDASATLMVDFQ
jgi:type 1 fimbria pilin